MTWAGRTRAGLFALLMVLLALSAVTLVSAGAEHHRAAGADHHRHAVTTEQYTPDDHQHGNEWTPTTSHRLRPLAHAVVRSVVPAEGHALAAVDLVVPPGGEGRGGEASILVLRV